MFKPGIVLSANRGAFLPHLWSSALGGTMGTDNKTAQRSYAKLAPQVCKELGHSNNDHSRWARLPYSLHPESRSFWCSPITWRTEQITVLHPTVPILLLNRRKPLLAARSSSDGLDKWLNIIITSPILSRAVLLLPLIFIYLQGIKLLMLPNSW